MSGDLNILHDKSAHCLSIITNITLNDYLNLIATAYKNDGALEGQRKSQTSKTAVRIRRQMVADFISGGVLPPVVIGLIDPKIDQENPRLNKSQLLELLSDDSEICIIDGMQRTTAMFEAVPLSNDRGIINREIRIEVWVSRSITKLIHRMLVLNTGQLPWSLRRQLEVVMLPIKKALASGVPQLEIMEANDSSRRTRPGEFQADKILELFLIFGARSEKADTREFISDEFIKLDFIESTSKSELLSDYIEVLKHIVEFDIALLKLKSFDSDGRFSKGIDLFTSQPALAGLVCALAIKIYGRPGADYDSDRQRRNYKNILDGFSRFVKLLAGLDESEMKDFMRFETLNSVLGTRTSASVKIGDMERAYFRDAFSVLVAEEFSVRDMEICWRA